MSHENTIREYHNHKEPDFDPETGVIHSIGSKKHLNYEGYKEGLKYDKEVGESEQLEAIISSVIENINSMELEDEFKKSSEQIDLLRITKKNAKNKILDVLKSVEDYLIAIKRLDLVKIDRDKLDQNIYLEQTKEADTFRKLRHNNLISNLHSAIRYIAYNFGDISEEAIEKWENDREEGGFAVLKAKRKKFLKNVICPDSVDINNRKHVMAWAVQLYKSLTKLKEELPNKN